MLSLASVICMALAIESLITKLPRSETLTLLTLSLIFYSL